MPDAFFERLRTDLRPKYELLSEIGSGGMGTVYLAEHVELRRRVAIKVIRPELANARAIERFRREGRALASVDHPGVIRVYDTSTTPSGIHFLEMKYAEGETLEARLERERPLPAGEMTDLAVKLLQALDKVHQASIVHRDLKPSNILLAKDDGHPILIDFGIAKAERSDDESLTEFRERVGTLRYMAPEQREGKDATHRTDIYAVGVVLYEAVSGKNWPWAGSEDIDWSSIPSPMREAIQRAVESRPQARWDSALEFATALQQGSPATQTAALPSAARQRFRPGWRLATVALLLIATAVWYWVVPRRPAPPDFAVLPFVAGAGAAADRASTLAWNVGLDLQALQVGLLDPLHSFRCAAASREPPNTGQWRKDCGSPARFRAEATVELRGDSLRVLLRVFDKADAVKLDSTLAEPVDSSQLLSARVALAIAHVRYPDIQPLDPHHPNLPAWAEFLKGEAAFVANEWVNADQHYQTALRLDSTFAYAAWRLAVVRAWMRVPVLVDLDRIYRRYGQQLPQTIRYQVRATLEPIGPRRV